MSKRIPIFVGFLFIMIAIWLLITPDRSTRLLIDRFENIGYDLQLRARLLTEHHKISDSIVIVDIDDKSLSSEGHWPWSRIKLGKLVEQLQKHGAAVIAFDIFLSEKEDNIASTLLNTLKSKNLLNSSVESLLQKNAALFDADAIMAKSLAGSQSILAIGFLPRSQTQNILPTPLLTLTPEEAHELDLIIANGFIGSVPILQQAAKSAGFLNIFPDSDGILRRSPLVMMYNNDVYPALALEAVRWYLSEKVSLITPSYGNSRQLEGIQLGLEVIPTDAKGQVLIPFVGRSFTFPYFSATDILHDRIPKDALLGKIIFVGTSATASGDLKATAVQNPFPGVEIQATIANGILMHNFAYKPAWTFGANIFITFVFGLIGAFTFPYLGPRTLGAFIILIPLGLFLINSWIFEKTGLTLSFLMPITLTFVLAMFNIIYGYLFETRKRERLKEMFGQYVPEKHIDEMLVSKSDYGLLGEDREMSVLFADIRNFTTISEGMSAHELKEMLNTFFTPMTEIIFKHRGTIDKYVGDLIMAFWGAPLKDKHHARHALSSALEMQQKIKEMKASLAQLNWPEIHIGVGINSGVMSVGDMGSRYRRNYTVLGDAVNLASRVEGLSKYYGVNIITTEDSQKNQTRFIFRQLDRVRVKGKKAGINIYEVVGLHSELTPELKEEVELSNQALQHYFAQEWEKAYLLFSTLNQKYPERKIYLLYLERIKEFKEHPLPPEWDGVYVHMEK